MRRWAPAICGLLSAACLAQEEGYAIHFTRNASRLAEDQSVLLRQIAARLAAEPGTVLVMMLPQPRDAPHRHLVEARRLELDRQLRSAGLTADHHSDAALPTEGDDLQLTLKRDSQPVPAQRDQPAIAVRTWKAEAGRTLRAVLADWTAEAGWSLVWQSSYDYPLDASAQLAGDFQEAVGTLLTGFAEAKPSPSARIFVTNRVLIIQ